MAKTWEQGITDQVNDLAWEIIAIKLGATSVANYPLAANSVGVDQIVDGSISAAKLAAGALTFADIGGQLDTTTQLGTGSITATDLATNSVTSDKVAANSITSDKIAANTITASNIAANTLTSGQIAAGTITADRIASGTLTSTQIQAGAINADRLYAGTVQAQLIQGQNIASQVITASNIATHTLTATQIAAATITSTEIASASIHGDRISAATITAANLVSGTITGAVIAAGTITAGNIATGTLTGDLIAAATIAGDRLVTGTVTATQIAAGTITGAKLTATAIDGMTITGALIRTAASGARVELTTGGFNAYNAAGTAVLAFDVTTGSLSLAGTVNANSSSVVPVGTLSGQIVSGQIQDGTITGTDIASRTILATNIVAGAITANEIAASTITATQIAATTITGGKIAAGTITAGNIAAGTITADKLTVQMAGMNLIDGSSFSDPNFTGWTSYGNGSWTQVQGSGATIIGQAFNVATTCNGSVAGRSGLYRTTVSGFKNGSVYAISVYARHQSPTAAGRQIQAYVEWYDRLGSIVGSNSMFLGTDGVTTGATTVLGTWQRFITPKNDTTFTAPANAATANVYFWAQGAVSGDVYNFAMPQVEEGTQVTPWKQYINPAVIEGGVITAGTFQTARTGSRVVLDATGLSYYNSGGTKTLELSATRNGLAIYGDYSGGSSTDRSIRWLDVNNSSLTRAQLRSTASGGTQSALYAEAIPLSLSQSGIVQMLANTGDALASTWIAAGVGTSGDWPSNAVTLRAAASSGYTGGAKDSGTRTLLRADGASDWLRVNSTQRTAIGFGSTTVTITNGTSAQSAAITHGLLPGGATPTGATYMATAITDGAGRDDYVATIAAAPTATAFAVRVRGAAAEQFAIGNPTTITVYWIAICTA